MEPEVSPTDLVDGERPHVVEIDDVHVVYRVYEDRQLGLRDRIATKQLRRKYREVHAVRGVSFVIREGDALGIIRTQELLEARRIDGGEQFFTRAVDFGYSKNAAESFEK